MNRFSRVLTSLTDGFNTARLTRTLDRMSDRQLADIGFTRETISLRSLELAQTR
jgi:uncharacterized protein YjiS (DUF1127 family)